MELLLIFLYANNIVVIYLKCSYLLDSKAWFFNLSTVVFWAKQFFVVRCNSWAW